MKPEPSAQPALPDTRELPLHDAIARQAYAIWESSGRPAGRDVGIWLEAERQVLGTDRELTGQAGSAVRSRDVAGALYPRRRPRPGVHSEPAALPATDLPGPVS